MKNIVDGRFELMEQPMRMYRFGCPYCPKIFKGKQGFDRCCNHIDRKHRQEHEVQPCYPMNHCLEFVNGEWRMFIP